MLKFYNYDIVCQEIPDEITLAINISGCPNHCKGCHSPWLWDDTGTPLSKANLFEIIDKYSTAITCVCFMGGDQEPKTVELLANFVRDNWSHLKVACYSGRNCLDPSVNPSSFNYVKLGEFVESLGGLKSEKTNQRLFRIAADSSMQLMQLA